MEVIVKPITEDIPTQLQEILPSGYSYKLKEWNLHENESNHFEATILTNIYTEDEAQEWWHQYNITSNTTMRVRTTCPKTGKVNIFKIYLRCLHQCRPEKFHNNNVTNSDTVAQTQIQHRRNKASIERNTSCPAGMIILIRRVVKYSRSKTRDPVDSIHPCEIRLQFIHNHDTDTPKFKRFRPVSKETEEKLLGLFRNYHSPASALEVLKFDLQIQHSIAYNDILTDRCHCPDKPYCHRLYYKHKISNVESREGKLNSLVGFHNTSMGEHCASLGRSNSQHIVAICTPLMKRAHNLQQASSMVYVEMTESTGNKSDAAHYVMLLLVHTAAGGVPLGAIATTSKDASMLTDGLKLLKLLLPENAFGGRGSIGPHAFLIDESESQKSALNDVWGQSLVIVCIYRILQSMWRYLFDDKHNIHKDHRLYLLYLAKTLLYASNESEMMAKFHAIRTDNIAVHYASYLRLVENIWQRHNSWGMCFHHLLPLEAASNYYEAAVRALKDKIFHHSKTFGFEELISFLTTRVDAYYSNKLLSILQRKVDHILRGHYPNVLPPYVDENIKQIAGNYYMVPSEPDSNAVMCTVDAELNTCTCAQGIAGAYCKHQHWIFLKMPNEMFKTTVLTDDMRNGLYGVVHGMDCVCAMKEIEHDALNTEYILGNSELPFSNNGNVTEDMQMIVDSMDTQVPKAEINNFIMDTTPIRTFDAQAENSTNSLALSGESIEYESGERGKKRVAQAQMKFQKFYEQVTVGLKHQPKVFLPAVEIMLQNLERKGNSSDFLISSLSFFGVFEAPHLQRNEKKKPQIKVSVSNEIVPRIYGKEMATYGKKRKLSGNDSSILSDDCVDNLSLSVSNVSADNANLISNENISTFCNNVPGNGANFKLFVNAEQAKSALIPMSMK